MRFGGSRLFDNRLFCFVATGAFAGKPCSHSSETLSRLPVGAQLAGEEAGSASAITALTLLYSRFELLCLVMSTPSNQAQIDAAIGVLAE